jgi:phosphopantetheinyl transferase (holo-ACP synthase)
MLLLNGWAATISRRKRISQHTVSISHTSGTAVATVVLVADNVKSLKKKEKKI